MIATGVGGSEGVLDEHGKPMYRNRRTVSTLNTQLETFSVIHVLVLLLYWVHCVKNVYHNYFCFVQLNSSDRALINAFREIGQMGDRLNLPRMIAVSLFGA